MNRTAIAVLATMVSVVHSGCDLFQTREPEAPTQSTPSRKPPDTPEIVLENFTAAIQQHNVENYMFCLVDTEASSKTFSFIASADFQGIFRNWRLEDERRSFQNLGPPVSGVPYINFSNLQQVNRTSSTDEFTMDYFLFYPHARSDVTKEVKGYMHVYLEIDNQHRWSIYRWEDSKTVTDSTWSFLKAHF